MYKIEKLADLKVNNNFDEHGNRLVHLKELSDSLLLKSKGSQKLVDVADALGLTGEERYTFILCGLIERNLYLVEKYNKLANGKD